jgi:glycerol-3-phosphate acyltransferase PlsY
MTIKLALLLFITYCSVFVLWVLYLAVMNLRSNLLKMGPVARAHGYALLLIAVPLDWLVNVIIGSLLFWDRPANWKELLTGRLKRYHLAPVRDTWRGALAEWICTHLLDPFDPSGDHC